MEDSSVTSYARGQSLASSSAATSASKVVFPLHGIRTAARWRDAFHGVAINHGWNVRLKPWYFGRFGTLLFLLSPARHKKIRWFRDTYDSEMRNRDVHLNAGELPSIVAHSFGTYILGYALIDYPFIRFNRVLLCGSILPRNFPWAALMARGQVQAVRNEYGVRDVWARFVSYFVRGAGSSGIYGFVSDSHARLEQAEFLYPHSEYFSEGHMEQYWLPFLEASAPELPCKSFSVVLLPSKRPWGLYAVLTALVLTLGTLAFQLLPLGGSLTPEAQQQLRSEAADRLATVIASTATSDGFRGSLDDPLVRTDAWTSAQCVLALITSGRSNQYRDEIRSALKFISSQRQDVAWGRSRNIGTPLIEVTAWVGLAFVYAANDGSLWNDASERNGVLREIEYARAYIASRQSPQGGWSSHETASYPRPGAYTDYATFMAMRFLLALKTVSPIPIDRHDLDDRLQRGLAWIVNRYDSELRGWKEYFSGTRIHRDLAILYLTILMEGKRAQFKLQSFDTRFDDALSEWLSLALRDSATRSLVDSAALSQPQEIYDQQARLVDEQFEGATVVWYAWSLLLAHYVSIDESFSVEQRAKAARIKSQLLQRVPETASAYGRGHVFSAAETLYALSSI